MLGFYALPVAYISTDTGIPIEGASKALQRLCDEGFCKYDAKAEVVWVVEMARQQIGEALEPRDKRCTAIAREYESLPNNQFLQEFFEEYGAAFHIKAPRDLKAPSKGPQQGASEAPSKPAAVAVAVTASETEAVAVAGTATAPATSSGLVAARQPAAKGKGEPGRTIEAWNAYSEAYLKRWGVEPTRNKRVNGQMATVLELVPAEDAPAIAAFYVRSNRGLYVSAKHPINLLARDAEALRTEWLTGKQGTEAEARQADQTAARGDQALRLIKKHGAA